jgi:curved DNA-binding protein CbpA
MSQRDYYDVLGLRKGCSPQDVKKKYHNLALKWHPDKNGDKLEAETKFNEIHQAYTILGDNCKRKIYDDYGHQGIELDQECKDFAQDNTDNKYYQKGFQGTNKSAFDVLRDIFEDNEEDYFFGSYGGVGISDQFKSSVKDFIHDNIISSGSDDNDDNFCSQYQPSFMQANFAMPSFFSQCDSFDHQMTSEFVSFTSVNSGGKIYSKSKKTVYENGKVKTSTKQSFQHGNKYTENEQYNEVEDFRLSNAQENEIIFTSLDCHDSAKHLNIGRQSKNISKQKEFTSEGNHKPQKSKKASTKKSKIKN